MTGYSGGKKFHGHPVGIAPQPKSMLAFALDRQLAISQEISDAKIAEDRAIFLNSLKKNLTERTVDVAFFRQKYTSELAKLKGRAKAPESRIRISAEKRLAKQRKNDRFLKNQIKNTLPNYLGGLELYQKLYTKHNEKSVSDDFRTLTNLYFYLYKELVRKKLHTNLDDFMKSMEDRIFYFHIATKKQN